MRYNRRYLFRLVDDTTNIRDPLAITILQFDSLNILVWKVTSSMQETKREARGSVTGK